MACTHSGEPSIEVTRQRTLNNSDQYVQENENERWKVENFNRELKSILQKSNAQYRSANISEIKNPLDEFNSRQVIAKTKTKPQD